jgi:hypothetical protein
MSEEQPVYLTTAPTPIESTVRSRNASSNEEKAFRYLATDDYQALLRRHANAIDSWVSSDSYVDELKYSIGDSRFEWLGVIAKVRSLAVFLTHMFSAKKGVWIGKGLKSRLSLGLGEATGTGACDDYYQRTKGFLFFLAHFGYPQDLKHMTIYGKEDAFPAVSPNTRASYAQRRYVCLDVDVGLYDKGLAMIHDVVWPRHLLAGRQYETKNVTCESIYENVSSGCRVIRVPSGGYDPHRQNVNKMYFRADELHLRCDQRSTTVRPLHSIVAGCSFREAVAYEVVRFALLLGKRPIELASYEDLIPFINAWIRPQVLLPWEVSLPANNVNVWDLLPHHDEVSEYLATHYKKLGDQWKTMMRITSRFDGNYNAEKRTGSSGGFRAFGWPREKYTRRDVRPIGTELGGDLRATGIRMEYAGLWNGLPELAAYSASQRAEITLDRGPATSTIIHPFEGEREKRSIKWSGAPRA